MANISSIQRGLKLKALHEAIEALKKKSEGKKNYVTYINVVEYANASKYANKFSTPISISSIKQPSSPEFEEIKLEITNFRKNHNKIVKSIPNKLKLQNESLTELVNNLTIQITEIMDSEMRKDSKIKNLQKSLEKAKEERNYYFQQTVNRDK